MEDFHINSSGPAWRQVGFWLLVAGRELRLGIARSVENREEPLQNGAAGRGRGEGR